MYASWTPYLQQAKPNIAIAAGTMGADEIQGNQPELESNPVQLRVPLPLQYKQQVTTIIHVEVI